MIKKYVVSSMTREIHMARLDPNVLKEDAFDLIIHEDTTAWYPERIEAFDTETEAKEALKKYTGGVYRTETYRGYFAETFYVMEVFYDEDGEEIDYGDFVAVAPSLKTYSIEMTGPDGEELFDIQAVSPEEAKNKVLSGEARPYWLDFYATRAEGNRVYGYAREKKDIETYYDVKVE